MRLWTGNQTSYLQVNLLLQTETNRIYPFHYGRLRCRMEQRQVREAHAVGMLGVKLEGWALII